MPFLDTNQNRVQPASTRGAGSRDEALRLLLDDAALGLWFFHPATGVVTADRRARELFGATQDEVSLGSWFAQVHSDDRPRVERTFDEAMAASTMFDLEFRLGEAEPERWVRSKGQVVGVPPTRTVAVVEDITVHRKLQEDLRVSEEGMRLAQEAAGVASWDWDLATGKFKWHPKGTLVYGRPASELTDLDRIMDFLHEEDRERVQKAIEPALAGTGEYQAEFRVRWPDGSYHWLIGRGQPLLEDGKVTRIVGVNMDVTERRDSESALRQNEKLAVVGRLASAIAHEINNPLESVTNLLYLVRSSQNLDEIQEYAETAEQELRRVSLIANQTLKFHKQSTQAENFYCHDLIGESLAAFQGRLINRHIAVEKRKRATQPVHCLGGEIRQVLSNLIGNAIDAMPLGGRLLLRSREATSWKQNRRGVVLTVADTGTGMSEATRKKIFEAFFTTKGIGGTGLGLWLSCEIVGRHSGELRVRSSETEGRSGTVFTLFLPIA